MKAVRISAPRRVELADVDTLRPAADEVVVEVAAAGICGTDFRFVSRGSDPPRTPGHEAAGTLSDGTPVGIHPDVGCGKCPHCLEGFENRCPDRQAIGLTRDGGMAEQAAVPRHHAVLLQGVPVSLAPLLEPLGCCVHAVSLLDPAEGASAMVVGAGPMGILAMWVLQARGCPVVMVQRSPERRELAARLGAEAVAAPHEDPARALGAVPEVAVVTAPTADALSQALEQVAVGGRVHAFAGIPGGGSVDANTIHYRHLALIGSTGSRVSDYRAGRDLAVTGKVPLERLPVTRRALAEAPAVLTGDIPDDFKTLIDVQGGLNS